MVKMKQLVSLAREFCEPYRVANGRKFRLRNVDPADTGGYSSKDKPRAKQALETGVQALSQLQEMLYAHDRWSVLVIFQAMDAAGKDSAIKHVMSGVNPQGCHVASFKAPSDEELDHDFLWRCVKRLPQRGQIGVFNRSYYEEVLAVRVHREFLEKQKLPAQCIGKNIWNQRFEDIRNLERYLTRNGVVILKFFLHVSRQEQKKRFLERLDTREKNWKFSSADVRERRLWNDYMRCYDEMVRETSAPHAPWYVVPADNKWFTRIVVAAAIIDALWALDLHFPKIDAAKRRELAAARKALLKRNA